MPRRHAVPLLIAASIAAALLTAGCSGPSDGASVPTASGAAPTGTASPSAAPSRDAPTPTAPAPTTPAPTTPAPTAPAPGGTALPTAPAPADPATTADPHPFPDPAATFPAAVADALRAGLHDGFGHGLAPYLAATLRVDPCAGEYGAPVDAAAAADQIERWMAGAGAWDGAPTILTDAAAEGDYAPWFPDGAIVGLSDQNAVISFIPDGAAVGLVFVCVDASLLHG